jgi:hypothetical protein
MFVLTPSRRTRFGIEYSHFADAEDVIKSHEARIMVRLEVFIFLSSRFFDPAYLIFFLAITIVASR